VFVGLTVNDLTHNYAIPPLTKVSGIDGNRVYLSNAVRGNGIETGDTIQFYDPVHLAECIATLWSRWQSSHRSPGNPFQTFS